METYCDASSRSEGMISPGRASPLQTPGSPEVRTDERRSISLSVLTYTSDICQLCLYMGKKLTRLLERDDGERVKLTTLLEFYIRSVFVISEIWKK